MADEELEIPEEYVLLLGANVVPEGISKANSIRQVLHWIGFRIDNQMEAIEEDGVDSWDSIKMLTNNDIDAMAKTFAGRTVQNGRMIFGTNRTKYLKAIANWTQDFYRVSEVPTIVSLNETAFKSQLRRAEIRNQIRKTLISNAVTNVASPGPLEKESKWKEWEEKFTNYLRLHLGANGIPLSYVIRENDDPDTETEHVDFIRKTTACAPLNGEYFEADRLTVFNFIVSFTTGQPSGDWVKNTERYQNGRRSMKALRDHFLGEGNATRSLADAERLRDSLHYKNERSMPFETFLTQCQRMFNIFKQENEPMSEDAKIRFLFKAVQHEKMLNTIEALRAQRTAGSAMTYTACCNHLTTTVTELPEYIQRQRNVSGVNIEKSSTSSIYNTDGTINTTGHIKDWNKLPMTEKRKVYNERKRLGVKFGASDSSKKNKSSDSVSKNTILQLRNQAKNLKRQIKALKREPSSSNDDSKEEADDAGDEFGGKNSKKSKKIT